MNVFQEMAAWLFFVRCLLAPHVCCPRWRFKLRRVPIKSLPQANGLTLLLLSAWFIVEAIRRLINSPVVEGLLVTVIAAVGIGVNLLAVWAMSKANRQSLNVKGSFSTFLPTCMPLSPPPLPAVTRLDDLHVWEMTSGMPALSGHVYVHHDIDCHDVHREVEAMLHDSFAISHITLQTDHTAADPSVTATADCAFERHEKP